MICRAEGVHTLSQVLNEAVSMSRHPGISYVMLCLSSHQGNHT